MSVATAYDRGWETDGRDGMANVVELAVLEERQVALCKAEIDKVLVRYNCTMNPVVMISALGVHTQIQIVAKGSIIPPPPNGTGG